MAHQFEDVVVKLPARDALGLSSANSGKEQCIIEADEDLFRQATGYLLVSMNSVEYFTWPWIFPHVSFELPIKIYGQGVGWCSDGTTDGPVKSPSCGSSKVRTVQKSSHSVASAVVKPPQRAVASAKKSVFPFHCLTGFLWQPIIIGGSQNA